MGTRGLLWDAIFDGDVRWEERGSALQARPWVGERGYEVGI